MFTCFKTVEYNQCNFCLLSNCRFLSSYCNLLVFYELALYQDSLGGNAKTIIIANISPSSGLVNCYRTNSYLITWMIFFFFFWVLFFFPVLFTLLLFVCNPIVLFFYFAGLNLGKLCFGSLQLFFGNAKHVEVCTTS